MPHACFRFYAELNDFLPPPRRQHEFQVDFEVSMSVKHLVEALGVAHTEVELILVNGHPAGFERLVQDGDRVSVYPPFTSLAAAPEGGLRPALADPVRFILDGHLGRLAAYLRMLGFDALYQNNWEDEELARRSDREGRILLTRDRGLLKRSRVTHGYCPRSGEPRAQAAEVLRRYRLQGQVRPFVRCLRCNGLLVQVDKTSVLAELQADTRRFYDEFHRCVECGQVYWRGAHFQRMQKLVEEILKLSSPQPGGEASLEP